MGLTTNIRTLLTNLTTALSNLTTLLASGSTAPTGAGTPFVFQKTVVSSTILTATATTFITATGSFLIEGFSLETDGTGVAGGTNLSFLTDNAKGLTAANIFTTAISGLGANKTIAVGGVLPLAPFVLETTKHIKHQSSVADCTGAGVLTVTVWGKRLTAGASLA